MSGSKWLVSLTVNPTHGGMVSLATGLFDAGSMQIVTATPNPQALTVTAHLTLAALFVPMDAFQVR